MNEIKKEQIVEEVVVSDTICAVPWMHLNFEPNGKVVPCCLTSAHDYFAGDLNEDSIEEIWNSNNMKTLRKEMIDGKEPAICNKCFDREKVAGTSGRTHHNKNFPQVLELIPTITEEDGACTTMDLRYWDFRFSNLCNFKCRSCGPRYSSAWVPDAKKLNWITEQEKVSFIKQTEKTTNVDFLKSSVDKVESIYFAGGEPLMMPEHWEILDMLVEKKRFDVKIQYNTNMSILGYKKKKVLDYWQQWEFGMIEVWPSIDEIGERGELIRAGTVWKTVAKNIKEGRSFRVMDLGKGKSSGVFEFASSNELWRASLDIIDFMPLTSVNYSGGIIITDWYSTDQSSNESIKISIRFLSNEIRSDALDIKVFNKKCLTQTNCVISEKSGNITIELKQKILKTAAIYEKEKKDKKKK